MSKDRHTPRIQFARADQQAKMAGRPHDHTTCREITGVNRPGKTRKDRWLKELS